MPKLKTKKTLKKRVKLTKTGKLFKKHVRSSHLKVKWSTKRRLRKSKKNEIANKGHQKIVKRLLLK